jgi:hypothetical protein
MEEQRMGHPAGYFGRIYQGLDTERLTVGAPTFSYEQWFEDKLTEQREVWMEQRVRVLLDVLHGHRPDVTTIVPCWAFAPNGERCLVWDDFAQWVVETHNNSNDAFVRLIRRAPGWEQVFESYAEQRALIECNRLPADYFEDGEE